MLESSHIKAQGLILRGTQGMTIRMSIYYNPGHSRAMHNDRRSPGNEAVESEYVELELHVFGKVIARAARAQSEVDDGATSRDCIYVYSVLPALNPGSDSLIGTIHGLGDVNPHIVCAVLGPDGKLTHKIVQHHYPLVKHMTWFKESGSCECRRRWASLLPSRYWILAPRSATHNVGGWYIETWSSHVRHRKRHSVRTGDEYGVVESNGQENSRTNPAMYIIAAAYKTVDEKAAKRRKLLKLRA